MTEESASPRGGWTARLARLAARVEDAVLLVILTGMIVLAAVQIAMRNLFDASLLWGDPALRVAVLWIGLVGAMVASREDRQISVDVLSRFLPARWRSRVRVITDLFTASVAGFLAWHAGRLVLIERAAGTVAFAMVPVWVCELILPIGLAAIAVRYLVLAAGHLRASLDEEPSP